MAQWIFFRDNTVELEVLTAGELAGAVFFDLWKTRQQPYTSLAEGDTIYLLDRADWTLKWECRVRKLLKARYRSVDEALGFLRQAYGLFPEDLNDYVWRRPAEGWFLAWATEVVAQMSIPLPQGVRPGDMGGRTGYLPLTALTADAQSTLDLPMPGRLALAKAPDWMTPELVEGAPLLAPGRYIPVATRHQILERDGGKCVQCGTNVGPMHVDHIYPFSKGGTNDPENLQLLCQAHNLQKAASIPQGVESPFRPGEFDAFCHQLGCDPDAASAKLVVDRAVERSMVVGLYEALASDMTIPIDLLVTTSELLLDRQAEPPPRAAATIALELVEVDSELASRLVSRLWDNASPEIVGAVALVRAECDDVPPKERRRLLQIAAGSSDGSVAGRASLELASSVIEDERGADATFADGLPAEAVRHLEFAARSPDLRSRGEAALMLGRAGFAGGEPDAALWLRRALVTPDDQVVLDATASLAALIAEDDPMAAIGLARRSLASDDKEIQERGHYVLACILPVDQAGAHLEVLLASQDPAVVDAALQLQAERFAI